MNRHLPLSVMLAIATLFMVTTQSHANGKYRCSQEHTYRSLNSNSPGTLLFKNQSNDPAEIIKIYWLNFKGKRVHYKTLRPGKSWKVKTFDTHPWVVTRRNFSGREKCIDITQIAGYNFTRTYGTYTGNRNNRIAARKATCRKFGRIRSVNSRRPMKITFYNKSRAYRSVMWIDYKGNVKRYADLNPGQKYTVNTYAGHPWMFTDGPGNCMEIFVPRGNVVGYNITVPNSYSGRHND